MRRETTIGMVYIEIGGSITLLYPGGECTEPLWMVEHDPPFLWVQISPYRYARVAASGLLWTVDGIYPSTEKTRWRDLVVPDTHRLLDTVPPQVITVAAMAAQRILA